MAYHFSLLNIPIQKILSDQFGSNIVAYFVGGLPYMVSLNQILLDYSLRKKLFIVWIIKIRYMSYI